MMPLATSGMILLLQEEVASLGESLNTLKPVARVLTMIVMPDY